MYKRIEWIDIAKGIGIFYVVMSHIELGFLANHVSSFYMPFFFFLSGLVFNYKKYKSFKVFILNKSKTILIPYFFISFNFLLIYIAMGRIKGESIFMSMLGIFYSRYKIFPGDLNNTILLNISNNALWFLTSLFIVYVIYYFINKISKSNKQIIRYSLICLLLGIILNKISPILLPWNLDTSLICIVFFALGDFVKRYDFMNLQSKTNIYLLLSSFISLVLNLICIKFNNIVNLSIGIYSSYSLFILGAVSGIVLYSCISIFIFRYTKLIRRVFVYLGQNTMDILKYHMILLNLFLIPLTNKIIKINTLYNSIFYGIILTITNISLILFVSFIIKKVRIYENKKINI